MRKSNILIGVFTMFCLAATAQLPNCKLVKDTVYYVSFDIRSKNAYPIQMSGIVKTFCINDFNTKNKEAFVSSFYKKFFYTPDVFSGYKKMLLRCMGDSLGNTYLHQYKDAPSLIVSELGKYSLKKVLLMKSGETVYLDIVKVSGDFWEVDKDKAEISVTSNEIDIASLSEINHCYVPFKIYFYKKPKQSIKFD